jgi:hypothetical protein
MEGASSSVEVGCDQCDQWHVMPKSQADALPEEWVCGICAGTHVAAAPLPAAAPATEHGHKRKACDKPAADENADILVGDDRRQKVARASSQGAAPRAATPPRAAAPPPTPHAVPTIEIEIDFAQNPVFNDMDARPDDLVAAAGGQDTLRSLAKQVMAGPPKISQKRIADVYGFSQGDLSKWLNLKEPSYIKQTSAAAVMARFLVLCAATAGERPIPAVVVPPSAGEVDGPRARLRVQHRLASPLAQATPSGSAAASTTACPATATTAVAEQHQPCLSRLFPTPGRAGFTPHQALDRIPSTRSRASCATWHRFRRF